MSLPSKSDFVVRLNEPCTYTDWTIRELAMYDFPALVEYVCDATGYDKVRAISLYNSPNASHSSSLFLNRIAPIQIAFIGHSQGNGLAFLSLSVGMRPEIGSRLSCFIALAPVVYAGPLTHGFPFSVLSRLDWRTWRILFGVFASLSHPSPFHICYEDLKKKKVADERFVCIQVCWTSYQ